MKHFIFLFALFMGSCSTTNQTSEPSKHHLLVTLVKGRDMKHLKNTYEEDDIGSIRASSRSQNIYTCQFIKDDKGIQKLMDKMKTDPQIIHVEEAKISTSSPTNSTNSKSAKARPGKN